MLPLSLFQNLKEEFSEIRRHLHKYPELKYQEKQTHDFVRQKLVEYGVTNIRTMAGTGIVAVIDSGKEGRIVALRADMDGLPMQELTDKSYKSCHAGVMHACGHDGHMAALLMAAKVLCEQKHHWSGKIVLIFQPAEEGGAGALKMITEGCLENPKVEAIFGYHNWPLEKGVVAARAGAIMAGADGFKITLRGQGGHAAIPQKTINPIFTSGQLLSELQNILAQKNPTDPTVLNICQIEGGTTFNVVPDEVHMQGTLRTTDFSIREKILKQMENIFKAKELASGVKINFNLMENPYPATINSKKEVEHILKIAAQGLGADKAIILEHPVMPAEDFSFYLQKIPGCFFFVGSGLERPSLHEATYDFNDDILEVAAFTLANAAVGYTR